MTFILYKFQMGRSKWKKKIQQEKSTVRQTEESTNTKVPIHNLPEKFLWMHVSLHIFQNYEICNLFIKFNS